MKIFIGNDCYNFKKQLFILRNGCYNSKKLL